MSRRRESERWLSVPQVAELIGMSRMTVLRAVADGDIPALILRGTFKIPRKFIENVVNAVEGGQTVVMEDFAAAWQAETEARATA